MIDNLLGDDDGEAQGESGDEDMDGLFDDPGDAGLDGGDVDGDLLGDDVGGDELGDDLGGDVAGGGGGGGGGAGANTDELENRLDELESEVTSLSSAVDTVKSENERISGSLDDVDENIRKLLEIYEMVTQGVNPFVNDAELGDDFGGGGGGSAGSMDLFGDDGGDETDDDAMDVDESVTDVDAEEFFEDDFEEDEPDGDDAEADGEVSDAAESDGDEVGAETTDDADTETNDAGPGSDGANAEPDENDGKSFEELKSEYDSDDDHAESSEEPVEADLRDVVQPALEDDEGTDAGGNGTPDTKPSASNGGSLDSKPYLETLPAGYVAETVVLEWLEFLVDEAGIDGAARTVAYYESIEWVSADAADGLRAFLRGFGADVDVADDPEPESPLSVTHHDVSLQYVGRIVDPPVGAAALGESSPLAGRPAADVPWSDAGGSRLDERRSPRGLGSSRRSDRPRVESDGGRETDGRQETDGGEVTSTAEEPWKDSGFVWVGDRT